MGFAKNVDNAGKVISSLFIIGFLGIVWLIIYGNLSGNLGFATGSKGSNDTEGVIANMTEGASQFFAFAPTWFTILGIVLLILILVGLLAIVMKLSNRNKSGSGFDSV